MFTGDFNTQLPKSKLLHRKWYRSPGFNIHSNILYDFLLGNDMCAVDLNHKQDVEYTYFNHSNKHYTWIDHVLCPARDAKHIISCKIIPEEPENVSDHLPLQVIFTLQHEYKQVQKPDLTFRTVPNWTNQERNKKYCELLSDAMKQLQNADDDPLSQSNLQQWVDRRLDEITRIIHSSAAEAGCTPKRPRKPKPYWCPQLSQLRDKKRMWWSIWVAAGRPRTGTIYDIMKNVKKQFRKISRQCSQNLVMKNLNVINGCYAKRNMKAFWNKLKCLPHSRPSTFLTANDLATYYQTVMTDSDVLTQEQQKISDSVKLYAQQNSDNCTKVNIDHDWLLSMLKHLKQGTAPGADNVTVEHLVYGLSPELCNVLIDFYSVIISTATVPNIFSNGMIIPVLKKPSSDPNIASNFRPITLSSVFSKLAELMIVPSHDICDTQFGFREGRGTTFVTSLITDCALYYIENKSPMFLCSLDAERCFDSIWHDGLLHKLMPVLPLHHWLFIHRWYNSTNAHVSFNGCNSFTFKVCRGMRQGSILSPYLFNIFLDDLLVELKAQPEGIRVHDLILNSCAYADDVTLFCATVPGLQKLIDMCVHYANKFRFKFGHQKSQCIVFGKSPFKNPPQWHLGGQLIETKNQVNILGVTLSESLQSSIHIEKRISLSRQRIYGLAAVGMSYPGLASDVKTYLWKTIGVPMMTYGMETIPLSKRDLKTLNSTQGAVVKRVMGIPKRSHHTRLLDALRLKTIDDIINTNTQKLYHRVFSCQSPAKELQMRLLTEYITTGICPKDSMIHRLINSGVSPTKTVFKKPQHVPLQSSHDGITDSIKYCVFNDNYIKPDSNEHLLVTLLLKAF